MSEQDLAALGAADEGIVADQAENQSDDQVEGQVETPPADADAEAEKTRSQERRERRKAAETRHKEEAAAATRDMTQTQARLDRIKRAAEGIAEPKETEFNDPLEYAAAKGAFHAARMAAQSQAREVEAELSDIGKRSADMEEQRKQTRIAAITEEIPDARVRFADFDKALAMAQRPDVVAPFLSEIILDSDKPLDLAYHLGSNPDLARQLSQMAPLAAARELGRLEASLSAPQPKLQSSAPAPISPVKGGGTASKSPETMSFKEFKAFRDAGGKIG